MKNIFFIFCLISLFNFSYQHLIKHRIKHKLSNKNKDIYDDYGYQHPQSEIDKEYEEDFGPNGKLLNPYYFQNDAPVDSKDKGLPIKTAQQNEMALEQEYTNQYYNQHFAKEKEFYEEFGSQQ